MAYETLENESEMKEKATHSSSNELHLKYLGFLPGGKIIHCMHTAEHAECQDGCLMEDVQLKHIAPTQKLR